MSKIAALANITSRKLAFDTGECKTFTNWPHGTKRTVEITNVATNWETPMAEIAIVDDLGRVQARAVINAKELLQELHNLFH